MKKLMIAAVAAVSVLTAGAADAASILFPEGGAGGASYFLNTGSGVLTPLTSGGTTPTFLRQGDYLQQTISGVGLGYVRQATGSLLILSNLQSAQTLDMLVNGVKVGSVVVAACPGCALTPQTYNYAFNFGSVLADSSGNYTLRLQMASSVPSGGGALRIAARDSSVSLAAVPEPATWGMMIVGFGMAGYALRRRRSLVAA